MTSTPLPEQGGFNHPEDFEPKKRHWELDFKGDYDIICTRCEKVLEHRDGGFPDYIGFMGGVFIKQNLPCEEDTNGTK